MTKARWKGFCPNVVSEVHVGTPCATRQIHGHGSKPEARDVGNPLRTCRVHSSRHKRPSSGAQNPSEQLDGRFALRLRSLHQPCRPWGQDKAAPRLFLLAKACVPPIFLERHQRWRTWRVRRRRRCKGWSGPRPRPRGEARVRRRRRRVAVELGQRQRGGGGHGKAPLPPPPPPLRRRSAVFTRRGEGTQFD